MLVGISQLFCDKATRRAHGSRTLHVAVDKTRRGRQSWSLTPMFWGEQNLPRLAISAPTKGDTPTNAIEGDKNLSVMVRDAFIAAPGHTLVSADYSQVELRLTAHVSEDVKLINVLLTAGVSGDTFRLIGASFLHKAPEDVTAEERQLVKRLCYGILYGQGKQALAGVLKKDLKEAERVMQAFLGHFPSLKRFIDASKSKARQYGYVKTLWGRRRPLPEINSRNPEKRAQAERQAVNTLIQGSAADIIKLAMIHAVKLLEEEGTPAEHIHLLMEIHDELVFEVPEWRVHEFAPRVKALMEGVATLRVPLLVNVKAGKRWGNLQDIGKDREGPVKGLEVLPCPSVSAMEIARPEE
eukprot:TRINITY_DN4641_c0_g1_i8.p1 TRINITY_DN4641_c0_g1~~TRINITY_DN4641_c0_g1_i8.p1  ORF type:complete len:354 (-),score=48.10 TRINITY_DN4641_c0_g1_i8:223-1284(-)